MLGLEEYAPGLELLDTPEGIELAFCPTGPGGGVDPTCGKGGHKYLKADDVIPGQKLSVEVSSDLKGKKAKVAKESKAEIEKQLGSIPESMRVAGGASTRVSLKDSPKDTPNTARAEFRAVSKGHLSPSGYLSFYPKSDMTPEEAAGNAVHEYGHAVDRWLGVRNKVGDGWISSDPEFVAAFEEDIKPFKGYLAHSHERSSPREMFAETYAKLAGGWRGKEFEHAESKEQYFERFPRSTAWVKGLFSLE